MVLDKQKVKSRIFLILRVSISAGILFFLFKTQFKNFEEIIDAFSNLNINYWFIILSFIMYCIVILLCVIRWHLLLYTQMISVSFFYLIRSFLIGSFFNNFLPGSIGGNIYRIYDTSKIKNSSVVKAATVVLMDRLIGFMSSAIFLMATLAFGFLNNLNIGSMMQGRRITNQMLIIFVIIIFIILLSLMLVLLFPDFFKLGRIFKKIKFLHRWKDKFKQIYDALIRFRKFKSIILLAIGLSFILQFVYALVYYFAGYALGINELSLLTVVFITQISIVITMLPISIGGIGVREGIFVVLAGAFGAPRNIATIVSLIVLVVLLIPGVAGSIFFISRSSMDKIGVKKFSI